MNKKAYIKPEIEVIKMDVISVLATSNEVGITDKTTDKDADLSTGRRGSWGNLW